MHMKMFMPRKFAITLVVACLITAIAWLLMDRVPAAQQARAASSPPEPASGLLADGVEGAALRVKSAKALKNAPNFLADDFLTPDLRFTVESMLHEASSMTTPGNYGTGTDVVLLKKQLRNLVPKYFASELWGRAYALTERYVDYRSALAALKQSAGVDDPRGLRMAMQERQALRSAHFTPDEFQALFEQEAQLDNYTLMRLEIERNTGLTPAQKQAALGETESLLGTEQRSQRSQATLHMGVAEQTASMVTNNTTDADRFAQRQTQFGEAAATRLAQLDLQEQDWQNRLSLYDRAAAAAVQPERAQALATLRQELFSEQELLRLDVAPRQR